MGGSPQTSVLELLFYFIRARVNQSEGWERISAPPGHVISQGSARGARVVMVGSVVVVAGATHQKVAVC